MVPDHVFAYDEVEAAVFEDGEGDGDFFAVGLEAPGCVDLADGFADGVVGEAEVASILWLGVDC